MKDLCRYVYLRLVDLKVDLTGRVGLHQPFVWTRKVDLKVYQTEINIPTIDEEISLESFVIVYDFFGNLRNKH